MVHGQLEVHAVAARNLKKTKLIGKPNAYVVMRIDQTRQRTKMVHQNADPQWNEKFVFDIIDNQNSIFIEVFDDVTGSDDLLGVTSIDLNTTFRNGTLDMWADITRLQTGQPAGQVRLVMYFRPKGGLGLVPSPVQAAAPMGIPAQAYPGAIVAPVVQQQPAPSYVYAAAPQQPMFAPPSPHPQPMYVQQQPQPVYVQQQPQPVYVQQPQQVYMQAQPQQVVMGQPGQPVYYAQQPGMRPY